MNATCSKNLLSESLSLGVSATEMLWSAYVQTARTLTLPVSLQMALYEAIAAERLGAPISPIDFDISHTFIGDKAQPVETACEVISSTCCLWNFRSRRQGSLQRPMLINVPYSGSRATIVEHLITSFLPFRDVSVTEWIDPHQIALRNPLTPKTATRFDLEDNTDDLIKCCIRLGAENTNGFDVMAISQGGTSLAITMGVLAHDAEKYKQATPSHLIFAGSPINTTLDQNFMNWMAQLNQIPKDFIIEVGPHYPGHGRGVIPKQVMRVMYQFTPDTLDSTFERQALAAEHTLQTHQRIFKENLLAKGQYLHRRQPLNLSSVRSSIMSVAAACDSIVPPRQTEDIYRIFPNALGNARPLRLPDAGHYDLVKPGRALEKMVHAILAFTECAPR